MVNMKIYTVGKSTDVKVQDEIREPFFVDKERELDNINSQNDMYCECVAMYYLWKHNTDDVVGIEHYRRNFYDMFTYRLLGKEGIELYLKKYDVIMPYKNKDVVKENLYTDISQHITEEGTKVLLNTIKKLYGEDEYNYYTEYLQNTCKCGFNLFITRKVIFDKYAEWYFTLIKEIEKQIKLPKRSYGYISEFLLYGFLTRMNLKIKNLPFLFNYFGRIKINDGIMNLKENYK